MSSMAQMEMTCAVCGTRSRQAIASPSSCSFGPRDLDTRPPLPLRATLPTLVRACPSCGYCARNLMEADERVRPVLESAEYRAQLTDESLPPLANRFLCAALIADARDQLSYAGWNRVHAAWACDDKDEDEAARRFRDRAVATFRRAKEKGVPVIEGGEGDSLLLAELLRRAGRFEEARTEIARGLAEDLPAVLATLLRIEDDLAAAGDAGCHTVPPGGPIVDEVAGV